MRSRGTNCARGLGSPPPNRTLRTRTFTWAPPVTRVTGASSKGRTSRTPATALRCAPSVHCWAISFVRTRVASSRSPSSRATARRSRHAADRTASGRVRTRRPRSAEQFLSTWSAVDVITTKRDGHELSDEAITWILKAYVNGDVAEEQMSALLMAIFFNGLAPNELRTWTAQMIASGERLDLSGLSRPTVDKHSPGGVGDKISLLLAPRVAACGAAVPQLSGRGLGHTGGTLDKLESIPGWRAVLTNDEIRQ